MLFEFVNDKVKQLIHCFWRSIKPLDLDLGDWRVLSEGYLHIIPLQRCKLSCHIFTIVNDMAFNSGVRAGNHSPIIVLHDYFWFELVLGSLREIIALTKLLIGEVTTAQVEGLDLLLLLEQNLEHFEAHATSDPEFWISGETEVEQTTELTIDVSLYKLGCFFGGEAEVDEVERLGKSLSFQAGLQHDKQRISSLRVCVAHVRHFQVL